VSGLALKEWSVVVRALLAGEQILDLRKGGLREDERRFELRATRFWLYPTWEHERAELVKPAYRRWLDDRVAATDDDVLRIEGWADVVGVTTVTDEEALDALDSRFVWTREYAESRLHWKHRQPLWVLALRAFRLVEPVEVPMRAEYAGCASWVEIDGLAADPSTMPSELALTNESFEARLKLSAGSLPGGFREPGEGVGG
jgi:hypothetical protein